MASFNPDTGGTLTTSLVSYWKLDESSNGTGAVTRNDSKATNHLTDNNTTPSATGKVSLGADFTPANSEYLSIADASQSGLDITGDMSIAGWVNVDTFDLPDGKYNFVSKWNGTTDHSAYRFGLNDNAGTKQLEFSNKSSADGTPTGVTHARRNWSLSLDTWYHVAAVYTAAAGEVQFYVDGTALGAAIGSMNTSQVNSDVAFNMGRHAAGDSLMDGLLDEFGIWSKALTSTEVADLYNSGNGNTYSASTAYSQTLNETVIFVDTCLKKTKRLLSDVITLVDRVIKKTQKTFSEVATIVDTALKKTKRAFAEALTLVDSVSIIYIFVKLLTETNTLADTLSRKTRKVFSEVITLVDVFQKRMARLFTETIVVADAFLKKTKITFAEVLTLTDTLVRKTKKVLGETITLVGTFSVTWKLTLIETITVVGNLYKQTKRILTEHLTFRDFLSHITSWFSVTRSSDSTYNSVTRSSDSSYNSVSRDDEDEDWNPVQRN